MHMNKTRLCASGQIGRVVSASGSIAFLAVGDGGERHAHIGRVLKGPGQALCTQCTATDLAMDAFAGWPSCICRGAPRDCSALTLGASIATYEAIHFRFQPIHFFGQCTDELSTARPIDVAVRRRFGCALDVERQAARLFGMKHCQ